MLKLALLFAPIQSFVVTNHPELVHSINPLKLYEYLACGLSVVSVRWDEIKELDSIASLCNTKEEFLEAINIFYTLKEKDV